MRKFLPEFIKPIIRFLYYQNERKKVFRERYIRKEQNKEIKTLFQNDVKKLIVFIVDGANWFTGYDSISGGILSIASIYEETEKLKKIHDCDVIMVTHPNAHLLIKHTQFPNNIPVFRFNQLKLFSSLSSLIIHIPEYQFKSELVVQIKSAFSYLPTNAIHLNILNQRIDIMPSPEVIADIKKQGYDVTQTTAHEQYSNSEIRNKFGIPLHKLSVYATPERYNFIDFNNKEDLILVSPDEGELKAEVLNHIKQDLPHFLVKVISGMTYMEYLTLIKKAKYMITFGEGLDFYFIETVFSGGVSFAVYNQEFFTPPFKQLNGVFNSYQDMADIITQKIKKLETDIGLYNITNKQQFDECHKIYNEQYYKQNLINFYTKNYLLP
jgi:hypothetical protein